MTSESRGTRILVIDADHSHRRALKTHLTKLGHTVGEAADGHAGWLEILHTCPDVVLCAEPLPYLSGTEILALVRADPALSQTPFILMAPQHDAARLKKPLEHGANEHLPVPFSMDELGARLRRALVPPPSANRSVMRGDLKFFSLPDVLIMTHQNRQTGLMRVEDSTRGARYAFLFAEGALVWVSGSDRTVGLKSFNRSLRITEGAFGFTPWAKLTRQPWHEDLNVNNILLGGIQEVDEMPMLLGAMPEGKLELADGVDIVALSQEAVLRPLLEGTISSATALELLDLCPEPDLEAGTALKNLLARKVLRAA